jgi:hypothetical protein
MHKKEKKDLFIQNYNNSMGAVAVSLLASKIPKSSYYNWLDPKQKEYDPEFAEAIAIADMRFCELVENQVWKKIKEGSDLWLYRYLQSHCPERWKVKHDEEEDLSGTIKLEITRKII